MNQLIQFGLFIYAAGWVVCKLFPDEPGRAPTTQSARDEQAGRDGLAFDLRGAAYMMGGLVLAAYVFLAVLTGTTSPRW